MHKSRLNICKGTQAKRLMKSAQEKNYYMTLLFKKKKRRKKRKKEHLRDWEDGFLPFYSRLYILCNVTIRAIVLITYRTLSLGIHVSLPLNPNQYRVC